MLRTVLAVIGMTLCTTFGAEAQTVSYRPFAHYGDKTAEFAKMRAVDSTDVVMLGNSITEFGGDWNRLVNGRHIRNRGIAGDDAAGIEHRLCQVLPGRPKAVFLMVGINDLSHSLTATQVADLCTALIDRIRREAPDTRLYVQSILPINESFGKWKTLEGRTDDVPQVNAIIKRHCEQNGITYIDLFSKFTRHGTNEMRASLTVDGLHLSKQGYKVWAFILKRYLKEVNALK